MKYEFHKFANIFPLLEGEQLEQLKLDIGEHGLLQSIVLFEGKILDGRNRYLACKELEIEPKIEEYKGNKPLEYVISLNLKRRHLNTGQRAVLAQEVMPLLEEEAEKRRILTQGRPNKLLEKIPTVKFHSAKEAQKIMLVNERDIRFVKKLKDHLVKNIGWTTSGKWVNVSDIKTAINIAQREQEKILFWMDS